MKLFQHTPSRKEEETELRTRAAGLDLEATALRGEVKDLRELLQHLDQDMHLMLVAASELDPRKSPRELAEAMHRLVFRHFDLASFFVAMVDREQDRLDFVFYHEGGRPRKHPSRQLSETPGLTGRAILSGVPLYTRTLAEAVALGNILTAAEKGSGLIPASWYGVPLQGPQKPFGLVSFQSFQEDAFPEHRRRLLDALSAMLAMALLAGREGK
jgi:hypothetical protein